MTSSGSGHVVETVVPHLQRLVVDGKYPSAILHQDMDSTDLRKLENEFQLMSNSEMLHVKDHKETTDVFNYHGRKVSSRSVVGKALAVPHTAKSNIPLSVKGPKSRPPSNVPSQNVSRMLVKSPRSGSGTLARSVQMLNKHTLEVQFINKKKRLTQLKKDLIDKQKPVLDLYQNLLQIKKRLEELGKTVQLEEVKVMPYNDEMDREGDDGQGGGEALSPEMVIGMQSSIEEIPKTLMDICKNLLSRRAVIVDLLESVTKSEVDVSDLSDKIETLKTEGAQLQNNLDAIINEHEKKIKELVVNWQALLANKKNANTSSKIVDLEDKLRAQEKLTNESNQLIVDLQRKLDDKRNNHDKSLGDLNSVIYTLKDQLQRLEQELEVEKKSASEYKNRNNANAQNSKTLRNKISELETDKKNTEAATTELNRKVKMLQDQLKHKEMQWSKEKEELSKNLKHQENLLQKLTADKHSFETRLEEVNGEKVSHEEKLQSNIETITAELCQTKAELESACQQRDEATYKCNEIQEYIFKMGINLKESMNWVSSSVDWGKDPAGTAEAQKYAQCLAQECMIRDCQDKIKQLELENVGHKEANKAVEESTSAITEPTEVEKVVTGQHLLVTKYQQLLDESAQKLQEKSQEVGKLTSEIRQLKVRQEHLEELSLKCPTENLQKMVEEGRHKLNELMKKSLESEQKIIHYENVIEKQSKQLNEMENLLRYRENMAGVLKASRDELVLEKESLTRYSHEMRTVLAEVSKEGKMKDRLIKELQEKIDLRERQINKLEKEIKELEANLMVTNEKRFKLQETIGSMEKELQSTKAHVNQLADINTRYEIGMQCSNSIHYLPDTSISNHGETIPEKKTDVDCLPELLEQNKSVICNKLVVPTNLSAVDHDSEINSKSLIGITLQKVDFLRSRLNYLTTVNVSPTQLMSSDSVGSLKKPLKTCSTQTLQKQKISKRHLNKILELTVNRYELSQKQAYESYAELTHLVKLAMSAQEICDK